MKSYRLYLLLPLLVLSPLWVNAAAYIKFEGIDGEAKDKDHKGWSDLSSVYMQTADHKGWSDLPSFSQGTARPGEGRGLATGKRDAASGLATGKRDAASGLPTGKRDAASGLPTGKRQHRPIRIVKPIDKATPMLAKALASGDSIGNVRIHRMVKNNERNLVLLNATVSAIETGAKTEQVTLNFQDIRQVDLRRMAGAKEKANKTK
ncbi:MAG: type VI secretion system tube protein Hcp [Verrucomicrobia bacterium]|nr:type VI secretion system tube protein Hcp [Verrucomicrobiota bacterium]